ncbi:MAG TPA: DivIVA domain-containing protein [Thermoleophilaceae bacterium]
MELDRHFIERNDFSAARRGYDPDEVDRHLGEIADAVNELKRSQKRSPSSLAATAADQVRGIVEAAERSASEIQEQAESEAKRIVDDASSRARDTRERADAEAVQRVSQAEEATERMLERTNGVESEIDRLLSEMRAAAGNLVENLRSSATSLNQELTSIREEYAGVRESKLEAGGERGGAAAAAEPEAEFQPEAVEDAGPVDAEPEIVAEVTEVEVEVEEAPAEDGYGTAEQAAVEPEPEPEPAEEEPEPAAAEAEPSRGGRSIRGAEGARLIALNMALNGTPRDETARYLSQNFDLDDQDSLLDEVYARVGG